MKKDYLNLRAKSKLLLLALLALFAGGMSPAWADELTIANGTNTNEYLPLYGYYADTKGTTSEFIIPASDLTNVNGKIISQLTFYISSAATKQYGASFNVYLEEVAGSNYDDSSASQLTEAKTLVYAGALDGTGSTMTIPFDTEYAYNGGNLLICIEVGTAGSYVKTGFYGSTTTNNAGRCKYSSTTGRHKFIPKTTLSYNAANPNKKPASIATSSITVNSAVVTWTSGSGDDSETGWNLEYKTSDSESWTEIHSLSASTLTYTLESLSANTSYDVRVSALYSGGESNWTSTNFKTTKISTPATGFTDNFETDKGWELINGTQTNKWVRGSATNNGGSNALYISNDGGTTNTYGHTKSMTFATKLFTFEAGDFTIAYDWKANGESSYDYMRVALVPASVELTGGTTPSGFSATGIPSGWQALDGGSKLNLQTDWQNKSVDITIESAGAYQVVFAWQNDGGGGVQTPAAAIDNFKIIGAAPVLELGGDVAGTSLAFGSVSETTNKTVRITNSGKVAMENITLTETADADNVFAYAELAKTTLAAGEYMDVQVTFSGSSAKDYTGTFRVAADGVDAIDVTVTATYSNAPAQMAVSLGEEAVGENVAFGSTGKQIAKTFTVTNDGDQTLNVTIASNNTTDFTVAPAALAVTGHTSETFTVTFVYPNENPVLGAEKTADITITPSNDGLVAKTFAVTGTRIEQWSEDFSGEADGWEITNGTYWKIQDGIAKGSYSYGNFDLITPSLIVEEGKTMSFDYRMTSTYRSLDIQYSKNNGAWTNLTTISYSGLTQNQWYTYTIEGLEAGKYKFRFSDSNYDLDNFEGFKRNLNDPKLGIYSDAECTAAVATSVTKDFGFATETQTATYYIKNDGTGTMTLALGDAPEGLTQNLDKTSVAAGEKATLTITMPAADNKGYHGGNVVVTATDLGTFTVAASGVVVDENKLNLNFATDNIPSTWTANDWMKDANGYIKTGQYGYSNTSMETAKLTAEAGEKLIVVAKNGNSSSSYTFGIKYKKADAAEWSDLVAATNIGASWTTLVATIAEAGEYLLQFNGYYANIQRIYGLSMPLEPVMVVYDGENVAAATYNFGSVANDADAVKTFSVKNEGMAALEGLTATLTGEQAAHYSVAVTGLTDGNLPAGETATVTVTQKKNNLGAHAATLTISATSEGIADKVIALSGTTRDASKLYADFASGIPSGWTATNWSASNGYAQSAFSGTCTLQTPAITVAAGEELTVDLSKQYNNNSAQLKVRYTLDGGITWAEQELNSDLTYGNFTTKTLSLGNAETVTAVLQFVGTYYARLDNFYGGAATTAPMIALTENAAAVENGSTKAFGNLTAEAGTATYTLTNNGTADMVSTVDTTGDVTAEITATTGEKDGNKVTLAAGQTATITVTMAYAAPYAEKSGAMTITSEGWVGDYTVNFTGTTIDPTALYMDFEGNTRPTGWYVENSGWTFTTGTAHVYTGVVKSVITEQFAAEAGKNVLAFDAKRQSASVEGTLNVYTSADRKTWTLAKAVTLTADIQHVALDALADGNYYVKFESLNASIDNLTGLKKIVPAPEHDFYVSATTFPTTTLIPETENGVTASVTVNSLRAEETGVFAKLYFDEVTIATTEGQTIAADGSYTFNFTANVPAEEKTYAAKVIVYNNAEEAVWETATADVTVAHTRTLNVTALALGEGQEATAKADASNQFTAKFDVTVENTGSVAVTPTVKIFNGETVVGTATAAEALAKEASTTLTVNAENISAGEGGELSFTAKAYVGEAEFAYATPVVINVTAAAPKFEMAVKGGDAVADGDAAVFGLVKEATTKTYTITNSGNKDLVLESIVAPEGYEATELTDENKTIAAAGSLDITVTLKAEQGKKNGNLVITYKVDESTNKTFTLALTGRSVAADTWTETFDTEIPATWTNGSGSNTWTWNEDRKTAYSGGYNVDRTLMTPRLQAEADEELTYDVTFQYDGYTVKVEYSTDRKTWNDYATIAYADAGEQTFVAPAAGNYYLRFTASRYANLDNFVGFKLNVPEHDTEIAAESVPTTGTQYAVYTATVTLKENAGKAEEVTANLMVAGEEKASKTETITANGTTTITLTWTPDEVIADAVKAKITVKGTGIDLATEEVDLTVAAPYTLDETKSDEVVNDTYPALILKHTFVEGWNTVCLPFDIAVSKLHAEAVAFEFTGYDSSTKELTFTKRTDLVAGIPYVVYVPAAVTTDYVLNNVEITSLNTTAASSTSTPVSFKGTYAPMTAGSLVNCFGLTAAGKIVKANASTTMKGFRGYFTGVPAGASARFVGFMDDELTGIRMITVEQNVEGVFNMQGQKVEQMKKGGLYIINGKKQVVK